MTRALLRHRAGLIALIAGASLAAAGYAQIGTTRPATSRPAFGRSDVPAERPPSLGRTMKQMNRIVKDLTVQYDDAARDESTLTMINSLQTATVDAKSLYPDDVGALTGDAKAHAIAEYRTRMIALLRTQLTLEDAILSNNRIAAKAALDAIQQQRKDGHEAYGVDEDDHH